MASTRPIEISKQSDTAKFDESFIISRSPSSPTITIKEAYVDEIETNPLPIQPRNSLGLPHKWRSIKEYEECSNELLEKLGIKPPGKSFHSFKLYIKTKDKKLANPPIYFIKMNGPGSYHSEFEAFTSALLNLLVPGIIPSAHVIFDPDQNNLPIGICTKFNRTFKSVKDQPVTENDLKNPEVMKWVANIIVSAYLLEEDDLHAHNFGWILEESVVRLMRVDSGMVVWNYLRLHPKLASFLSTWTARAGIDRFPVVAKDIAQAPNFKFTKPWYSPSGMNTITNSSADDWRSILHSKNAYLDPHMDIYKKPENLEKNPLFQFYNNKLITKLCMLSREIIKELGELYLRNREGDTKIKHSEEFADHIAARGAKFRETLLQRYELALMTNTTVPEKNKLYVRLKDDALEYMVVNPLDVIIKDKIDQKTLENEIITPKKIAILKPFDLHKLAPYLEKLLAVTSNRDHTQTAKQFATFVKRDGTKAINDILDECDALRKKIEAKRNDTSKPYLAQAYCSLFACMDPENKKATMNEEVILNKWDDLYNKVLQS